MSVQEILEKYGFARWIRAHVGDSFYVWQEDVDKIADELKEAGYALSALDLINAGQETTAEYEARVFLYTSQTGDYLESLITTRAAYTHTEEEDDTNV